MSHKKCPRCNRILPKSNFYKNSARRDGLSTYCKKCEREYHHNYYRKDIEKSRLDARLRNYKYRADKGPMGDNIECPAYLGVYITESLLHKIFNNVTVMKNGNIGYDFICGKGYKVDGKSSVLHDRKSGSQRWFFHIGKNIIADYFICVGFDNRHDLNVMHVWFIPGDIINTKETLSISITSLKKWEQYEQNKDSINECCMLLKSESFK